MVETVAELLDLTAVRKGFRNAVLADCMPCCCCCSCCCCKSEYE
jgi:hypothetical protein